MSAPRLVAILLGLACSACLGVDVSLNRVRGLYTTHFEGIPDQAAICGLVANQSDEAVEWVRLRLRARSHFGAEPLTTTSHWVFAQPLAPGQSRAVLLPNAPVAQEIELEVQDAGTGPLPRRGLLAGSAEDCSDAGIEAIVRRRLEGRTAPGIEIHPIARLNDPEAGREVAEGR